ncbi:MAG: carboxymethylenebutenolidase, partial [Actinomycetota bacterium]|nr:carboxymethylenebutenolidase [Actinomycetota bacterium]
MIEFGKRKDAGTGYLARSERVGPCVLVLHEFFGLTQAFKDMADDLNAEGFTVLAPDLYDGKIASSVEEAKELS